MAASPVDSVEVERLLAELCVRCGYCLPPDEQRRIIESPPADVDAFTDAVLVAEGRDLTIVLKSERRALRAVVAKWFGEQPIPDRRSRRRRRSHPPPPSL